MKKKIFIKLISLALCVILSLGLVGCDLKSLIGAGEPLTVISVAKTATDGLTDTYTIYFSDGTSGSFTVTNGEAGKDGEKGDPGKDGKDGEDGGAAVDGVGILEIRKTDSNGLTDTYTIFFTNGTETTFQVTNGRDGDDITALSLYESYKEKYGETLTYSEFLEKYLSVEGSYSDESFAIVNDCLRSAAKVYTQFTESSGEGLYTGSAFIYRIDADYTYFITNYHVVYDSKALGSNKVSDYIHCYLYGSEGMPVKVSGGYGKNTYDYGDYGIRCTYVGGAANYDIAVIRASTLDVKAINPDVKAVTLADNYYVGETAFTIGNPNNDGLSVTKGVVSVDNEYVDLEVGDKVSPYRSIRIDTPLYHGNSGGALFNSKGQLIGVSNAGSVEEENINYAIPIHIVKGVVYNTLTHLFDTDSATVGVYKPTLGVSVVSKNSKYVYSAEGGYGEICEDVVVSDITYGSIFGSLGISVGDKIKKIIVGSEEFSINRIFDVGDVALYLTEGVSFSVVYERSGTSCQTATYTVKKSDLAKVS